MLDKINTLIGYKLHSLDGEFGNVKEFYFDDHHWTIRYLVADTGIWRTGRQVLISPYSLTAVNREKQHIAINLTQKQIEDSPSLITDQPVSRQYEEDCNAHYGWPTYWQGPFVWGASPYIEQNCEKTKHVNSGGKAWDYNLRSTLYVSGNAIQATDGEVGHVDDFVIDDETWKIRYLVIDTRNWWPGKKVLISSQWIDRVSWDEKKVFVNLSRDKIKQAPAYSDESLLAREYEIDLHRHYNRKAYWDTELPDTVRPR